MCKTEKKVLDKIKLCVIMICENTILDIKYSAKILR